MRRLPRFITATTFCAALLLISTFTTSPISAQTLLDNYPTPRTAFGHPDIGGLWTNVTITPRTRPSELGKRLVYTEEEVAEIENRADTEIAEANQRIDPNAPAEFRVETTVEKRPEFEAAGGAVGFYNRFWLDPGSRVMRVGGHPRTSILTTIDGQIPPAKEGVGTISNGRPARSYDSYKNRPLGERCVIGFGRNGGPPMFANGFYNNNYQILQTSSHVMILVEMIHDARIIRLNSEHRSDGVRPWFGDAIGRWEGKTLTVETTNLPEAQAFSGSWKNLIVTERFTRVAKGRLHYQFTIDDPTIWDSPWGGEYEFSSLDGAIYEYACHEGNYALPGILKGARVQEAEAAIEKSK